VNRFLLLLFFTTNMSALCAEACGQQKATTSANGLSFRVSLDQPIRPQFFDSMTLQSIDKKASWETDYIRPWEYSYDTTTHIFKLQWCGLKRGRYRLCFVSKWGTSVARTFFLGRNTNMILHWPNRIYFEGATEESQKQRPESLCLYYFTTSCFGGGTEHLFFQRLTKDSYRCTLVQDTIAYKREKGATKIYFVPVARTTALTLADMDSLFEWIDHSLLEQKNKPAGTGTCFSTSQQHFCLQIGQSIFPFYDFGLCNWNKYILFRDRIFNDINLD
jgi:hypothetical protein